jgi:hypothetical protein
MPVRKMHPKASMQRCLKRKQLRTLGITGCGMSAGDALFSVVVVLSLAELRYELRASCLRDRCCTLLDLVILEIGSGFFAEASLD